MMAEVVDRLCRKINIDAKLYNLTLKVQKEWFSRTYVKRNNEVFKWRIEDPKTGQLLVSRTPARELVKCSQLKFKKLGGYIVVTGGSLEAKANKTIHKIEVGSSHLEGLPAKLDDLVERLEAGSTKPSDGAVELALMIKTLIRVINRN